MTGVVMGSICVDPTIADQLQKIGTFLIHFVWKTIKYLCNR